MYQYGETPLFTYEKIAKITGLNPDHHYLELGAGRGRGAAFLSHFFKCPVTCYEVIKEFTMHMELQKEKCSGSFKVVNKNFLKGIDKINQYSVIYIYGLDLSESDVETLCSILKNCSEYTQIITISYSLEGYLNFRSPIKKIPVSFAWGKTLAYLHII